MNGRIDSNRRTLSFVSALCLLASILLSGCATEPYALPFTPVANEMRPHRVFAVGHGWHVGLVLPAAPLVAHLPALKDRFKNTTHFELGWGDKGFYQAQEITTGLTLQAMFWSTGAAMHVVSVPASPDLPFDYFSGSDIVEVCVSDRELSALAEFVQRSFRRDAFQQPIKMKNGIYGDSQFYEAQGRYHFFNTCNKWVAKGLSSMGFSIDPTFALTSGSLLKSLKTSGRAARILEHGVVVTPLGAAAACTPAR